MSTTAGRTSSKVKTERSGMSLKEFEQGLIRLDGTSESKNILVYGDSNAGKTVLAGTCPPRVFWLIGEPGYKSAARFGAKGSGRLIDSTAAAWTAVDWLWSRDRYKRYEWIVTDGLSTMEKRFRLGYAAEAFDINPSKRQHRNLPDRPDYFNTQNFLISWLPRLIDLPVNLLVTAHPYRTEDDDDADLRVYPGIQGKNGETSNAICGLMDAVGYMGKVRTKQGIVRRILWEETVTKKGVRYIAGDKFNALGRYMDDTTIPEIIARIDGEESK